MNLSKKILLGISFIFLLLAFSSCNKENLQKSSEENLPEMIENSELNFKKDIEILSANRKNKATVTVSSNNEAILATYDASIFSLTPVFEKPDPTSIKSIGEENVAQNTDMEDFSNEENPETIVRYELNVTQKEDGAIAHQLGITENEEQRYWKTYTAFYTNKTYTYIDLDAGCLAVDHWYTRSGSCNSWIHDKYEFLSAPNNNCSQKEYNLYHYNHGQSCQRYMLLRKNTRYSLRINLLVFN